MELLLELLIQIFGDVLFEAGLKVFGEPFRRQPRPWMAVIGYTLFGFVLGGLSLLVFDKHMMVHGWLRIVNLIVTPVIAGFVMMILGAWHLQRGEKVIRADRFFYGYLFALSFAVIRFEFAD